MAILDFQVGDKERFVEVDRWTKYGKDRLYIRDRRGTVGYYDFVTEEFVIPRESNIANEWLEPMKAVVIAYIGTSEEETLIDQKPQRQEEVPVAEVKIAPTEEAWKLEIHVASSFSVKDELKALGYEYDSLRRRWSLYTTVRPMKDLDEFDDWILDEILPEDIREAVETLTRQLPAGVKVARQN